MTDDPNQPQRIPPSLVTPVRNLISCWAGPGKGAEFSNPNQVETAMDELCVFIQQFDLGEFNSTPDGPDPILHTPQRHGSIGPSLETDCIPALDCVCGFTATGETWSEAGENLEAHLTEKEVPDGR